MTANEYQKLALRTINPELNAYQQLQNGLMGLCGEAGEALDILKKHMFQNHPWGEEELDHIEKELGDVAWYLSLSAYAIGCTLEDVLVTNIKKLEARYPEKCFSSVDSINRKEGDI